MSDIYDLIIIGGGPSGFAAGIYAGRADLKTLIIEKDGLGGQIGITSEIVNYPGIKNISGSDFLMELKQQVIDFGTEYVTENVIDVDFTGDIKIIKTKKNEYKALGVIISTGAKPRSANFQGEEEFKGHGVGYCATCDGQFFKGLDIFVVGGGFAAAEESIFLTRYANKVHILVRKEAFSCSKTIAEKVMAHEKIDVHFNTEFKELTGDRMPRKAVLINNKTGEEWTYEPEEGKTFGVFVFVGYEPISGIFKGKVDLDSQGYIVTDEDMKTSVDGVYAAGDVRPKKLRQLVTAVSDGAVAATNIEKYIERKKETLDLSIHKETQQEEGSNESIFDDNLKNSLKPVLERFENNVLINVFTDESTISEELKLFLNDFSNLSEKVKLNFYSKGENAALENELSIHMHPAFTLHDHNGKYQGIKYHGIPNGHEFNSFVLALYNTAGPGQEINEDTLNKIKSLGKKINIKIGVSLTCTLCPDVVMASQLIAAKNENVTAEVIDVFSFPEFKEQYNIMSVPCVVVNDSDVYFGKKSIDEIIKIIS